jgi:acetyl-CoA C-acetyltransferase
VVDPRTPVLVGVAQLLQRPDDIGEALEPAALMAEAVRAAAADAGSARLLEDADVVTVVKGAWSYPDPAALVAATVGATNARTVLTTDGGNTPQLVVNVLSERIAAGKLDVAVVVGAETIWSRRRMRRDGVERAVTSQPDGTTPDERLGAELVMTDDYERSRGLELPVQIYPLFETAIRHRRGETLDEHRDRVAEMWADFNAVAVANPYAWSRAPMTAADIRDGSAANRMVAFPYTKAMCSNWDLDQAAALVLCSAEAAQRFGVPGDRWVFVHGGTEADDTPLVSHRRDLGRSPAIAAAWRALRDITGVGIDDVAHLDVYSCFPSAVEAATEAIGIDESRRLTVTGGLTFAGGPLNNYVTHSIATMVDVLRGDPEALGLVTANGGFLTKHALGLYSATPPARPFRRRRLEKADVSHEPRDAAPGHVGSVVVEAYTVMHDHNGPIRALFAATTGDGRRVWGTSDDAETMATAMKQELCGCPADVDAAGTVRLS